MGGQYANEVRVAPVLLQPATADPGSIPIGPGLRHYFRWRFCVSSHARSTRVLKCGAAADRMGQSHLHRNEVLGQCSPRAGRGTFRGETCRERFNREGTKDAKILLVSNPSRPWRASRLGSARLSLVDLAG